LLVVNATSASLFRITDECEPTLLIDEAEMFLRKNEFFGILNSGHTRDAFVIRTAGRDHKPLVFRT
jgi:putative DNA primase/helicase